MNVTASLNAERRPSFYRDRYVREGDDWKFKSRQLNLCYLVPPGDPWSSDG